MNSFLKQTWLVLALAGGFGMALAGVDGALHEKIVANEKAKLARAACEVLSADPAAAAVEKWAGAENVWQVRAADGGRPIGWAVKAVTEKGYGGRIELMIGLSPDAGTITGLQILKSNETPGLGDRMKESAFRVEQFRGKPADTKDRPLTVVKPGQSADNPVHAITGATISSKAVTGAVNDMLARVQATIRASIESEGQP